MAMAIQGLSPGHIKMINYCRLYLQVLTLSDICNAEGTQLVAGMSQGNRNRDQSYSILEEPLQERPNAVSWGIWRRFLQHMCYDNYRLLQPLGPWYARLSTRRRWPCYTIYLDMTSYRYFRLTGLISSIDASGFVSSPTNHWILDTYPRCLPLRFPSTSAQ
jgi:hypothetical protein